MLSRKKQIVILLVYSVYAKIYPENKEGSCFFARQDFQGTLRSFVARFAKLQHTNACAHARDSRNRQFLRRQLWEELREHVSLPRVTYEQDEWRRTTTLKLAVAAICVVLQLCSQFLVPVTSARYVRDRRNTRSQFGDSQQLLRTLLFGASERVGTVVVFFTLSSSLSFEEFQLELCILEMH